MKKRTKFLSVGLIVLITLAFGAQVWLFHKKPAQEAEKVDVIAELEKSFQEMVKGRPVRDVPITADFKAYTAAALAKTKNDFVAAAPRYAAALKGDSSNPDLITNTYLMYVLAGDVPAALPYAQLAHKANPADLLPKLVLISHFIKNKQYPQALALLNNVQHGQQLHETALYPLIKVWIYAEQGQKQSAYAALSDIQKQPQLSTLYYLNKGMIDDIFKDIPAANKAFEHLIAPDSSPSLNVLMILYDFYKRIGQLPTQKVFADVYNKTQETSFVTKELMHNPRESYHITTTAAGVAMVFFDMASLMSQLSNYETSLFFIQLADYLNPDSSLNKLFLGEIWEELDQPKAANSAYRALLPKNDLYLSMQLRLASNLKKMGQEKAAEEHLLSVIDNFPNMPIYHLTLGDIYRDKAQYGKAIRSYATALHFFKKEEPQAAVLFFNLGVCYEKIGQQDKAETFLRQAVQLDPKNPVYLNYLGYVWVEQNKNVPEAVKMIELAATQSPNDGNILDSLAWAYYKQGQYDKALPFMEKAVIYESGNAVINDHLGDIYWRLGRFRDARFQWTNAKNMKKENSTTLLQVLDRKLQYGLK